MELLDKRYDPKQVEDKKYDFWLKEKLFSVTHHHKQNFSIVIPPPNVTGKLHLGHAWDGTLQDILIRFHHSLGKNILFLAGMDHAGIATQAVVEARLRTQGISRFDLGRTRFLEKMWEWKDTYALNIRQQWAKLGFALNYDVERFTLDEQLSKAVKTVFVRLYQEGLIYRGERIINWDPEQKTALSNVEVIHKNIEGHLYHFKYLLKDGTFVEVATTRPETMFGDVCLVVHPQDERYLKVKGQLAQNPANGEWIPIIADEYVDMNFGTGVMKCTPAHDPNDFTLSEKHHLERPICMNLDGTMNERAHRYQGMKRFDARAQLVQDLTDQNLLIRIEKIVHAVGHSERSDTIIEPYLSKQWFVKMKPLAEQVLALQTSDEKIQFFPERFDKVLTQWMEKVEDWTISRQLWWGHQIPAYYHNSTGDVYVGEEPPKNISEYTQDPDVLDTWFSSALWPFSTLGWPDLNADLLKQFFPISVMVTGYDIIFFWVARMVFQSLHFVKQKPFHDVYIHGIIRDSQGRKMSKSLGNGVDPMDVIHQYGADALRYYLATNSTPGQDTRYIEEKVVASSNYLNKIWNTARFIFSVLPENFVQKPIHVKTLTGVNAYIYQKLVTTIETVKTNLLNYEIGLAATYLYNFVYDDFCSWYLEFSKVALNGSNDQEKELTYQVLFMSLKNILILMHPFAPFITEEIYQKLPQHQRSIFDEEYPNLATSESVHDVDLLVKMIQDIRNFKVEQKLPPNAELSIFIESKNPLFLKNYLPYLNRFSFSLIEPMTTTINVSMMQPFLYERGRMFIQAKISKTMLIESLQKELNFVLTEISRAEGLLSNSNFVKKAPAIKIKEENEKLELYRRKKEELETKLNQLK